MKYLIKFMVSISLLFNPVCLLSASPIGEKDQILIEAVEYYNKVKVDFPKSISQLKKLSKEDRKYLENYVKGYKKESFPVAKIKDGKIIFELSSSKKKYVLEYVSENNFKINNKVKTRLISFLQEKLAQASL